MKGQKLCRSFNTIEDSTSALGTHPGGVTLNELGLPSKEKPDGSIKCRIIWDLLRSAKENVLPYLVCVT